VRDYKYVILGQRHKATSVAVRVVGFRSRRWAGFRVLGSGGRWVVGPCRVVAAGFCGRSQCWVAAFRVRGRSMLAVLFITIRHCAWRHGRIQPVDATPMICILPLYSNWSKAGVASHIGTQGAPATKDPRRSQSLTE